MAASPAPDATPPVLSPMLAGGDGVPADPSAHQMEPKFDGQRILANVGSGQVSLWNRRGTEATATFPELSALGEALEGRAVVLDGEVVAPDAGGRPSFQRLQRRMHVVRPSARLLTDVPVVFAVFDVLWLDGELLIGLPQSERREVLESLALRGPTWQTAPVLDATPEELLEACREAGLEGFMAKRLDAPYLPGRRSTAWSKVKCARRREFVVGGWTVGQGARSTGIGSLALGCYDVTVQEAEGQGRPQRLFYVGQAGSGLSEETITRLSALFSQIATDTSPFANRPPMAVRYVEPRLVVEVQYTEVTEGGTLRQPSIKGLRTDVLPAEVVADDQIRDCFA